MAITIDRTCGMARLSLSGKPICACEFAFCLSVRYALYRGRDIWCISYRHALPDSVCSSQRISPVVSRDRRILWSSAFVLSYNIPYVPHSSQGQARNQADLRKSLIFLIIPSLSKFCYTNRVALANSRQTHLAYRFRLPTNWPQYQG